jgi:hypothetical protein
MCERTTQIGKQDLKPSFATFHHCGRTRETIALAHKDIDKN